MNGGGEDYVEALSYCPNLKDLSVSSFAANIDSYVSNLSQHCPKLERLSICRTKHFTNKALRIIADSFPLLKSLCIELPEEIADETFAYIMTRFTRLEELTWLSPIFFSISSLETVFSHAPASLKELTITGRVQKLYNEETVDYIFELQEKYKIIKLGIKFY
jgi:hypothetical protein